MSARNSMVGLVFSPKNGYRALRAQTSTPPKWLSRWNKMSFHTESRIQWQRCWNKKRQNYTTFKDGCPIENIFFSAETCEFQRFPAAVPMDTSPAEPDRQVEGPENGCVQYVHLLKLGIQQLLCEKVPGISFTKGARFKFHQFSASLGRVPILYKHETTYLLLPLKICNLGPCVKSSGVGSYMFIPISSVFLVAGVLATRFELHCG